MKIRAGLVVVALLATGSLAACTQGVQQDLNQIGPAQDVQVQSDLQAAATAARTYESGSPTGTLAGFTAAAAAQVEPSVKWTDGAPAAAGQVSIRGASAGGVVLVAKSESGNVLCIAETTSGESKGKQDAKSPAECTGGW